MSSEESTSSKESSSSLTAADATEPSVKPASRGLLRNVVLVQLVLGIGVGFIFFRLSRGDPYSGPALTRAAVKINAGLPRMIDGMTRIDQVVAGDRSFTYRHTLLVEGPVGNEELAQLKAGMRPKIRALICQEDFLHDAIESGIVIRYQYQNAAGEELLMLTFTGGACAD